MADLDEKIRMSIDRLKAFEPPEGYLLAFSGGKDSVVIKALADMAGVKYEAQYRVTGIDPPELVRFIRDKYPDVKWDIPRYPDGRRVTMWNLIERKGIPPTRMVRYCCDKLKETAGIGRRTLTGVRWAESASRMKNHGIVTVPLRNKADAPEGLGTNRKGGIVLHNDNDESRRILENCYAKNKMTVNPIIDWTDEEVWEFIHGNNIPYCELYDCGRKRLGCIGCPLASRTERLAEFERYPRYKTLYLKAFEKMQESRVERGKGLLLDNYLDTPTAQDVFDWWMEEKKLVGQTSLFGE